MVDSGVSSSQTQSLATLRLLSLDDGGICALSSLTILETIMHRIQMKEDRKTMPLPSEYFSMIAGSGTGGIIAIMLGPLRMSIEEAIYAYRKLADDVFKAPNSINKADNGSKFQTIPLEKALKDLMHRLGREQDALLMDENCCETFVCAMNSLNMNARTSQLLRTYPSEDIGGKGCTIWQAARATCAIPTFFEPMFIDDQPYISGGLGNSNPTSILLREAQKIFPGHPIACIFSLGTGKDKVIAIPAKPVNWWQWNFRNSDMFPPSVMEAVGIIATECESTHEEVSKNFSRTIYFRFNVEQGLQNVPRHKWEWLPDIKAHTWSYTMGEEVNHRLSQAVAVAVAQKTVVLADRGILEGIC